jgi:hypothetical protein
LASCDEQTLKRWEADLYRYPTFTYREAYLWKKHKGGMTRVADATEREFFMNKPKGITSKLFKKSEIKFGVEDFDTVRCAAIGTSHHVGSLGALLYLGLGRQFGNESMRHPGQQRECFLAKGGRVDLVDEGPRRSSSRSVTIGLTEGLVSPSGHADDEVLQHSSVSAS